MREEKQKIIYYSDPLNDDFVTAKGKAPEITPDFKFIHRGIIWRALSFLAYRVIMTPVAALYCKIKFRMKTVDRRTARPNRRQGCFLYSNHTLLIGDAFVPTLLMFPKKVYVVVSPANLSARGTRNFLVMNGALPLPKSAAAFKKFVKAVGQRIDDGACVTVYPEAHVWPYYTGIRPFPCGSFRFAVKNRAPIYVSTTTFSRKKHGSAPRVTVYLDGPFYPDDSISPRAAEQQLRDTAYSIMSETAKLSTYSPIEYRREEAR